jgi:hypothetical protein
MVIATEVAGALLSVELPAPADDSERAALRHAVWRAFSQSVREHTGADCYTLADLQQAKDCLLEALR